MAQGELQAQLEQFRIEFRARLAQRTAALAATVGQWLAEGADAPLREAHEAAHRLAGSGATFGAPEVTTTARALEHLLAQATDGAAGPELRQRVADAMRALEDAVGTDRHPA